MKPIVAKIVDCLRSDREIALKSELQLPAYIYELCCMIVYAQHEPSYPLIFFVRSVFLPEFTIFSIVINICSCLYKNSVLYTFESIYIHLTNHSIQLPQQTKVSIEAKMWMEIARDDLSSVV